MTVRQPVFFPESSWNTAPESFYSIGLVVYIVLIIAFAYFYTSITFNPLEIANNMKKAGTQSA
mgnify:CR=1 FL=1